ncbi:tartronate semialdehyde reductase [Methylobrevis pamukkalensis]|uniref:Tartronate semialdehyde reductase n=1 Tax=Methylobrevis pamukkalensis TaxID=1439726 RepID=A0A1E3H033_9HYPH|nr:tartronate semialdehyde reductase [Methylobrevis pamukkalensis]
MDIAAPATTLRRIALLGTGLMGAPMARRMAAAGFAVTAWNRSPDKAQALTDAGITVAEAPAPPCRMPTPSSSC